MRLLHSMSLRPHLPSCCTHGEFGVVLLRRSRLSHHVGYSITPCKVVLGLLMCHRPIGSSINLNEHELRWVVNAAEDIKTQVVSLFLTGARVCNRRRCEGILRAEGGICEDCAVASIHHKVFRICCDFRKILLRAHTCTALPFPPLSPSPTSVPGLQVTYTWVI